MQTKKRELSLNQFDGTIRAPYPFLRNNMMPHKGGMMAVTAQRFNLDDVQTRHQDSPPGENWFGDIFIYPPIEQETITTCSTRYNRHYRILAGALRGSSNR